MTRKTRPGISFWPAWASYHFLNPYQRQLSLAKQANDAQRASTHASPGLADRYRRPRALRRITMANLKSVDLMDIGEHCSLRHCNTLDFLPFTCDACNKTFCLVSIASCSFSAFVWVETDFESLIDRAPAAGSAGLVVWSCKAAAKQQLLSGAASAPAPCMRATACCAESRCTRISDCPPTRRHSWIHSHTPPLSPANRPSLTTPNRTPTNPTTANNAGPPLLRDPRLRRGPRRQAGARHRLPRLRGLGPPFELRRGPERGV
jgi:hypothetical protein